MCSNKTMVLPSFKFGGTNANSCGLIVKLLGIDFKNSG
jgi:hypothetical protein